MTIDTPIGARCEACDIASHHVFYDPEAGAWLCNDPQACQYRSEDRRLAAYRARDRRARRRGPILLGQCHACHRPAVDIVAAPDYDHRPGDPIPQIPLCARHA